MKLIFKLLRYSGLPFLFRELFQRNKVTIILFHDITQTTASQSFRYLSKHYNIIDLNDFIKAHKKRDLSPLPPKALIITFDDGHLKNYELLPIIKETKIPLTIFMCAGIVNTNRHFWFQFKKRSTPTSELKRMANQDRLERLSKDGFYQSQQYDTPQALQMNHIKEMASYINLESHTIFHPCLPQCSAGEAKEEIYKSKEILETMYGLNINTISYPNGDYSDRDIQYAKAAGYKCGITVDYGFNSIGTDIFRLKRLAVNDTPDINELIVKASGLWAFIKTLNGYYQKHGYTKSPVN